MMKLIILFALLSLQLACSKTHSQQAEPKNTNNSKKFSPKVIYGDDNRLDLFQVPNPKLHQLSRSTVALVSSNKLTLNDVGEYEFHSAVYGERYGLCADEAFFNQPNGAFCSGFLVKEDVIVTAGHCIRHQSECESTKFVFDYGYYRADQQLENFQQDQVFSCKEIIHSFQQAGDADYAVIKLDRPVPSRTPLDLAMKEELKTGDDVFVIGHPAGLPTKYAPEAQVRKFEKSYFIASLDTYGGNSGSAVFNSNTNKVEGILVRGEMDFVFDRAGCRRSKRCKQNSCRGEDVTNIQVVKSYIPDNEVQKPKPQVFSFKQQLEIHDFETNLAPISVDQEVASNKKVYVEVDIDHTYIGDLTLTLITPNNEKIKLHDQSGYAADFIKGVYGRTLIPVENISAPAQTGLWKLEVKDHNNGDQGQLNFWSLVFE